MAVITHVVIKRSTFGTPFHHAMQAYLAPFRETAKTGPYPPPRTFTEGDPGPTMIRTWRTLEQAQAYIAEVSKWTDEYVERCYIAEIIEEQ